MKLSIVTPVFNGAQHIRDTIQSVILQEGDFDVEYIIMDGGSTDDTVAIVQEYKNKLEQGHIAVKCRSVTLLYVSEKDQGMYDAINRGFSQSTGDIFAWINADDYYLPGAFEAVVKSFMQFPDVRWLKGTTCFIDESETTTDKPTSCAPCYVFNRSWIRRGIYGRYTHFIHQDSVFWRRSLWDQVGPIDTSYKLAGDYWLWTRFAEHTSLYSLDRPMSVFRSVASSLSHAQEDGYRAEQNRALVPRRDFFEFRIKLFFWLKNKLHADRLSLILYPLLFKQDQKDYIDMTSGMPIMKKARSYIA